MKRIVVSLVVAIGLTACSSESDEPALEPNALYRLAVTGASIKATNNGANWDDAAGFEAPDVFVRFWNGTTFLGDTGTVHDSYVPTWTQQNGIQATVAVLRSGNVMVQVWDEDALVDDEVTSLGSLTFTDDQIRSGSYVVNNWDGANSITFAIAPAVQ